ncbi:class I glutamine amidotransferase-like protein [Paraphaeosphaeria sporulosa]|uniref:Class I glutamine amidotransferase-like protein n=1 Tax=Paraphaeosphaeria sporulosa TaxID=1460663 RepID=A0A177C5Q6_9PLEO|nr:class I glutamine amidotransferase-like protein [Paraphaeosphaeria sporulosa]OAG02108.1 class I glutamine amidotransferase-like protein [Paraphaeosphaeria sporulosa]
MNTFQSNESVCPVEILFALSGSHNMTLSTIGFTTGPVDARSPAPFYQDVGDNNTTPFDPKFVINPQIIATHDFSNAPPLDILIVPGGTGDFLLDNQHNFTMEHFIASRFDAAQYVLSVCTGATTLARAGVLAGRRATTNKSAWKWATASRHGSNITWVPSARWVEDGKVWTSSGVAAGMDMMYAFAGHYWGWDVANATVNKIEYTPHADRHWDAFAVVHDVPGADRNESLTDCLRPAGW